MKTFLQQEFLYDMVIQIMQIKNSELSCPHLSDSTFPAGEQMRSPVLSLPSTVPRKKEFFSLFS